MAQLRKGKRKGKRLGNESDPVAPVVEAPQSMKQRLMAAGFGVVLVVLTFLAYSNSFVGKFIFDDSRWIVEMSEKRAEDPISFALKRPRPVVDYSLALNYKYAEQIPAPRAMIAKTIPDPYGYHVVNLIIHLIAGLALFGVVRRTILIGPFSESVQNNAHYLAFAAALLWMVHPLQTQAVTYMIQRAESMMGMFFLLTLYCFIRSLSAEKLRPVWIIFAIVCCMFGMGSKAVMVTAPFVILAYDRIFAARSWSELIQRRWIVHLGLFLTIYVLVYFGVAGRVLAPGDRMATVGFAMSNSKRGDYIRPEEYMLSQPAVIWRYLKLSILPTDQILDNDQKVVSISEGDKPNKRPATFGNAYLPSLALVGLLGISIFALIRKPWLGFLGIWFFFILGPTSSFIPIKDIIYEHRMYLSLAAVTVLFVVCVYALLNRLRPAAPNAALCAAICSVAAVGLGFLTFERNALYGDPIDMWADNVRKAPTAVRAYNNLAKDMLDELEDDYRIRTKGEALSKEKKLEYRKEAIRLLQHAVEVSPSFMNAWYNLGNALLKDDQLDEAAHAYKQSIRLNPRFTKPYLMLGNAYTNAGTHLNEIRDYEGAKKRFRQAEETFRATVELAKKYEGAVLQARAMFNLANTYMRLREHDKAMEWYQKTLETNPNHPHAELGIANVYIETRQYDIAQEKLTAFLQKYPNDTQALAAQKRLNELMAPG